jgi:hypothetical protein
MKIRLLPHVAVALAAAALPATTYAQPGMRVSVPQTPDEIRVPAGNTPFLKGLATGTQNYICLPGANGPAWKFVGPQATLFVTFPWFSGEGRQQIATHFLSSNPTEGGTARPTWQHSLDTSAVWGKVQASSSNPDFVAVGAIPWLLLEAAGTQRGPLPLRGSELAQTTFIQRVNTSGGMAPTAGCDAASYGAVALEPYTADYYFYRAEARK